MRKEEPTSRSGGDDASPATGAVSPVAVALSLGIGSQLSQVVLVREWLMVFHGNEVSIGIALAGWLLWVGVGSFLGARMASRGRGRILLPAAFRTAAALLVILPATILGLRGVRYFFSVMPGESLSFRDLLFYAIPLMAPACLLWGLMFVLVARLWQTHPAADRIHGGIRTYAVEATGNWIGGLIFTVWLVHRLSAPSILALAGILLLVALGFLAPPRTFWRRGGLVLAAAAALAMPWMKRVDAWSHGLHWRTMMEDGTQVETRSSRYGAIAVFRRGAQHNFFQSGHRVFSTGAEDAGDPAFEEQDGEILAQMSLAQHPEPRRVLLIGGGMRGVLRAMLAHPVEHIDYVEIDPVLLEVARGWAPAETRAALDDPRVRVLTTDGRMRVKTTDRTYDVVVADVPDPVTAVLNRYYTREFFLETRRILRPGGLLVIGATSTAGLRDAAGVNRNAAIFHTLEDVFARVLVLGERDIWFLATDAPDGLTADPRILAERVRSRGAETAGFPAHSFFSLLQDPTVRRLNWVLRHHGRRAGDAFAPPEYGPLRVPDIETQMKSAADLPPVVAGYFINSDFRPIGYFHSLMFWGRHTRGGEHGRLPRILLRVRLAWLIPVAGLLLLLCGVARHAARHGHARPGAWLALGLAVWTTGLASMSTQVALLFAFQSQYGFVYEMIGLIVAGFMAGLTCGALICPPRPSFRRLAWLQLGIAAWSGVLAFGFPLAARLSSSGAILFLFAAMTFLAGVWNGANFPLALACAARLRARSESTVGRVYGLELIGAAMGALVASLVIIPVLGIVACCLFAAALNGMAFFAILIIKPGFQP